MVSLPPGMPFTAQLTPVLDMPVTLALNSCVSPRRTFIVPGATLTSETAPFTCALMLAEFAPPGFGLVTETGTTPTWELVAVPVADNCVEETRVVASATEPKLTTAPCAKCAPFRVRVNGPTGIVVGEKPVSCGVGFSRVAGVEPDFVESEVSVAVMVMPFVPGGNSGALNNPVEEIVPVVELPPATPLTLQVRVGLEPSFVLAVNCCMVLPRTIAFVGETVMANGSGPEW